MNKTNSLPFFSLPSRFNRQKTSKQKRCEIFKIVRDTAGTNKAGSEREGELRRVKGGVVREDGF